MRASTETENIRKYQMETLTENTLEGVNTRLNEVEKYTHKM